LPIGRPLVTRETSNHVTSQTAGELYRQFNDKKYNLKVRKYVMQVGYTAHLYSLARQHQS
jgi:hypothetical protein